MKTKKLTKVLSIVLVLMMAVAMITPGAFASGKITVDEGDTFRIYVPCDCGDTSSWVLDFESYCVTDLSYVGQSGVVVMRAVEPGRDTIHFVCESCNAEDYFSVTVNEAKPEIEPIGLYLSEGQLSLSTGDGSVRINAYYDAGTASMQGVNLQWSVSDPEIIDLETNAGSATVTPRRAGKTTITVTDRVTGESDKCYVGVYNDENYSITLFRSLTAHSTAQARLLSRLLLKQGLLLPLVKPQARVLLISGIRVQNTAL